MKTILLLSTVAITSLCGATQAQIPLDMPHPRTVQQAAAPTVQQPSASEPSESIDVGGSSLTLGMAQDYVLQHLGAKFKLTQASTTNPDLSSVDSSFPTWEALQGHRSRGILPWDLVVGQ